MAKFAATDYSITIDSEDLSASLASCTLDISVDDLETTSFGNDSRTRIGGLRDATLQLDFHQDFAASALDSVIEPLIGTVVTVVILPTSSAVGAANPSYSFSALVSGYSPFSSSVGDLATTSVSWAVTGDITRAVA